MITNILQIVDKKIEMDYTKWPERSIPPEGYFNELRGEIDEAERELVDKKCVYMADELGDILWAYLNLVRRYEREGIVSLEDVLQRCEQKYTERIDGIAQGVLWNDIKQKQKQVLKEEQNLHSNI